MKLVYLHGFRSTPGSAKARQLQAALARRPSARHVKWVCPQLPPSPAAAIATVTAAIGTTPPSALALVGSSLGGYYATWLAECTGCRAVLVNPAIRPYDDLRGHLGRQPVYGTPETIDIKAEYLDELLAIDTPQLTRPERYLLVAATGDEVIDWRTMVEKYVACAQRIVEGSDHALADFDRHIDAVLAFCGIG